MNTPTPTIATPPAEPRLRLFQGLRGLNQLTYPGEIIAGVTLAALAIPLNIGYAEVAGLPPVTGLYAAVLPMLVYGLFSSSRQLVAGPDAAIAALIGSLLLAMAAPADPRYVQLAYALVLECAVLFFAMWFFRLGFLANFLSRAVLVGFVSGLGIEIFTSQVPKMLGFHVEGDLLAHYGLLDRIGEGHLYRTNQEALVAYLATQQIGNPPNANAPLLA